MEKESFIYTISSSDRLNNGANQVYYDIDFGGFSSDHENYKIQVVNCVLSGSVDENNGYLIMTCNGLNDDGVFCEKILNASESVVCVIPTNVDVLMSNGGVEFKASNIRMSRRIRFKFMRPDFSDCIDGDDINVGNVDTSWLLTLRMTPIIN
jgi:hypothetical protein